MVILKFSHHTRLNFFHFFYTSSTFITPSLTHSLCHLSLPLSPKRLVTIQLTIIIIASETLPVTPPLSFTIAAFLKHLEHLDRHSMHDPSSSHESSHKCRSRLPFSFSFFFSPFHHTPGVLFEPPSCSAVVRALRARACNVLWDCRGGFLVLVVPIISSVDVVQGNIFFFLPYIYFLGPSHLPIRLVLEYFKEIWINNSTEYERGSFKHHLPPNVIFPIDFGIILWGSTYCT